MPMTPTAMPVLLLFLLMLMLCLNVGCQLSAKIYQSANLISATSNHELTMLFKNTEIPIGSYLQINYSTAWNLASVTGGNATSDYCETGCSISGVQTLASTASSHVQIKNLFPRLIAAAQSRIIRYTIKNIVNPSYAMNENLLISLLDNTGAPIDIASAMVTVSPRQITCSSSRTSTLVSAITQYQITINPSPLTMPANLYIMMYFPSMWSSSTQTGTFSPTTSTCVSTINPAIACPQVNGNINASNVLASSTSSSFSFSLTDVRNPGSAEDNNQLTLQFYSSAKQIAYCTVPITASTPKTIPDFSISLSGTIGAIITATASFSTTEKVKTTDIVQLQFPKEYGCGLLYAAFVYLNGQTVGREATLNIDPTSATKTVISLQPFFSDSIALYAIELFGIQLPKTTATVPQIKLSIIRNGALVASQSCCSNSYPVLTSSTGLAVSLASNAVGSSSTHYLTIRSTSAFKFPNDYSYLMVQFDPKYALGNPVYNCYIQNSVSLITSLNCNRNSATKLLISNFNSGARISNTLFTIGIDAILTPITLSPLSLTLITLDTLSNPIEQISATYTLSATKINNIKVTPAMGTTYAVTQYTLTITNTNALAAATLTIITFPAEIKISPSSSCYINGTLLSASNCIVDTTGSPSAHQVTIGIGNSASIPPSELNRTNITITLVNNPLSLRQTSSFSVQLVTSLGEIIEQLREGIFLTLTTPATAFTSLTCAVSDDYTMSASDYTIGFQLPVDVTQVYGSTSPFLSGGAKVVVVLPGQFGCVAQNTSRACMVTGESELLTYTLTSTTTTTQSFTLPSVVNPSLVTITSTPLARLYLSGYLSIEAVLAGLTTFRPSIISYTLSQSNYQLGQKTKVFINMNSISNWVGSATSRTLKITPPPQYAVDGSQTITCNVAATTITKIVSSGQLQEINIAGITSLYNVSITISKIINPSSASPASKWAAQLRDTSTSILMAVSNTTADPSFALACTLPCKSCLATNSTHCLSCYSTIPAVVATLLDSVSNTCVSACLASQYLGQGGDNTCYACSPSCLTCANVSYNCTSCSSSFLYQPTSKCVQQCPPEYYASTGNHKCTPCLAPCLYCSGPTGATCTLCQPSMVLSVLANSTTTCTSSCSPGYYNHSNICTACSLNCNQCNTVNYCTVCASPYLLYNGQCMNACPSAYYISIASGNLTCEVCQSPCLSCQTYSTYCTSCTISSASKYLVSTNTTSTCSTACPLQYFADQYFVCVRCISPCEQCVSPTTCTSCLPGYYFYSSTQSCHSVCPPNTILTTAPQQCTKCTYPCLTCSPSVTTCTSCAEGYFLDSAINACNLTCTSPYFAIDRKCTRCATPCATCVSLQPYACISCLTGYYLFGTTCYAAQCPDGSYRASASGCAACTSGCLTCITTSSTCLSCYPGLYLYQQACLPSCPTSPVLYYEYQMQCIACQPQCTSCISSPVECASCSNPVLYFNEVTRECTTNCTSPYYAGVSSTNARLCIKCKLPCKTCGTTQVQCTSCYNGLYLDNQQCVQSCPPATCANTNTNTCQACSTHCLTCTSPSSCTLCQASTYSLRGACYLACPSDAPYIYASKYCRNCLLDYCLLCNGNQGESAQCLLCQSGYYLYEKQCIGQCPAGYEPDSVTMSLCVSTSDSALLAYLKLLQKFKVYLLPGSSALAIALICLLCYLWSSGEQLCPTQDYSRPRNQRIIVIHALQCLVAIPQAIALVAYLTHMITNGTAYYHPQLVDIVLFAIVALFFISNAVQLGAVSQPLGQDKLFIGWVQNGNAKNGLRYRTVLAATFFNKRMFHVLFCGLWRIPVTCCQLSPLTAQILQKRIKILYILTIVLIELPIIAYLLYTLMVQKYLLNNYKLFYASIDNVTINVACICISLAYFKIGFHIPAPYRKYILDKVSNRSLAGHSEQIPEEVEEDDDLNLHRSNSTDGLKKQSDEMKAVQFKSVFDPSDFQDPQFMEPVKIQNALNHGKFRKKNMKKKKRKDRNLLDIIDQDSQESEENAVAKPKKKITLKKKQQGFMNNYLYWKPPEKVQKKQPQKQFKMHEKQIMQTIRQKQSDFDTITRNDIIFQQEPLGDNSSHDSDPNFQIQDSRRALNYQYEAFINKNYAKRRHMG